MHNEFLLKYDTVFKSTFKDEETIKRLLEETLDLKINKVCFTNTEMPLNYKDEKLKILDLIIYTDKGIINVEVNNGYKSGLDKRNLIYFCKLVGSSLDKHDNYINMPLHIQLNLTWNLSRYVKFDISNRNKLEYSMIEKESHEELFDNFRVVTYNMDYYLDKWYNNDIDGINPFMLLLAAPTIEDMKMISKGDSLMEKITDRVNMINFDPDLARRIAIENEEEKFINSAKIEGREMGIAEGRVEGRVEGANETKKDIAKKLLDLNISIEDISAATGLTKEEIEEL